MQVDFCEFPDDVLYDFDNNVWIRREDDGHVVLGITSILSALAGKLTKVSIKPVDSVIARTQNLATVESPRYFGAVKSPLSCTVTAINEALLLHPKLANDYPYSSGWFAQLQPTPINQDLRDLSAPHGAEEKIRSIIKNLHVRCFKAYPDHELWEVGVECAAVLVRLNEMIESCSVDEIIHVVSDDPTADIEMVRWADQSGQTILESRSEGNLKHFIVKKGG